MGRLALVENAVGGATEGDDPFRYAVRAAINAMKEEVRRDRRVRAKETEAHALAVLSSHQIDAASCHEPTGAVAALDRAIDALLKRERAVVRGVDLEGQTLTAVAAELGVSIPTACRLRQQGHARLRKTLTADPCARDGSGKMAGCLGAGGTRRSCGARGTSTTRPSTTGPGSNRGPGSRGGTS